MANPRAFISFDFDNDELQRRLFIGQSINSKVPFSIEDWSSKEELIQSRWESIIEAKIKKCHMMIILVGRNMRTATGVTKEVSFALSHNIPFFGVYVDGAGVNSFLPAGLPRNRTITWSWSNVASAVQQMMKEGKNTYL